MTKKVRKTQPVNEIPCPVHNLPIKVEKTDVGFKAVCTCNVPNNNYKGRVVWERIPPKE